MKLQSALEYLTTYGWAILIIGIALVVLFSLVNADTVPTQECVLPAGFACISYYMSQNGMLTLNLLQSTQYPISVTAVGCNSPEGVNQMDYPANQPWFNGAAPANIPIGANETFQIQCFSNSTKYYAKINQVYTGYIIVNYTNAYTEFPNTIYGRIVAKITK